MSTAPPSYNSLPLAEQVLKAADLAVTRAIERHRRLGESIVVWRDGRVVEIPAAAIPPLDETRFSPVSPIQHAPDERLD